MRRAVLAILIAAVLLVGLFAALLWFLGRASNPPVELAAYQTDLSWPIALAFAPDGRIFYAERFTGSIRIIRNDAILPTAFFTIADVGTTGEQGLLGLTLAPNFSTSPYVYAYHTFANASSGAVYNRIVRILADGDIGSSVEVILDRIPASSIHDGGVIAFGPDGMLYAVAGDAANSASAQDLASPNGKVLRMTADGTVPADNPFVNTVGANPYVFTYGHRNMFGIAWHPVTRHAFVTENGPTDNDEINVLEAAGNYGWPDVRGIANTPPYIDPIRVYTPVIAPTNAAFYTGSLLPQSTNDLVFGDWNTHRLHDLRLDPTTGATVVNETILATAPAGILDVEMGPDGQLWVTTPSTIYRLVASATTYTAALNDGPLTLAPGTLSISVLITRGPSIPRETRRTLEDFRDLQHSLLW